MKNSYPYLLETQVYKIQVRMKENPEETFDRMINSIEKLTPRLAAFSSITEEKKQDSSFCSSRATTNPTSPRTLSSGAHGLKHERK